eukprot:4246034-Ditylum_brightwellii.AAC.1
MVKRGFWQQGKIDAFWSKYHGTVLAANKYKAPDLEKVVQEEKYGYLTKEQRSKALGLLRKHEQLFQGKQGEWRGSLVTLQLKPGAK